MATKHKLIANSAKFDKWWSDVNRLLISERETEMLYGKAKYWWAYRKPRLAPNEAAQYEIEDRQSKRAA